MYMYIYTTTNQRHVHINNVVQCSCPKATWDNSNPCTINNVWNNNCPQVHMHTWMYRQPTVCSCTLFGATNIDHYSVHVYCIYTIMYPTTNGISSLLSHVEMWNQFTSQKHIICTCTCILPITCIYIYMYIYMYM